MYEVVIIGAGIAGCTAAIYASRKRMNYLLVSKSFGGQFLESGEILNYPGIVQTNGEEFSAAFEKQLKFNGVEPLLDVEIKGLKREGKHFLVITDDKEFQALTVIIATGSNPRKINVPGEKEFARKGVTYCSICDGPLFAGKDIAIIGGGNSALEAVDFTAKIARKIFLININENFTGHEYLIERIKSLDNVIEINKATTLEITGEKFVNGLVYQREGTIKIIDVQGVIIEAGRKANTDFVKNFLEFDEQDHIKIDCQSRTSIEGVFAAGDCASGLEYQYVIAGGQGCIALLKAARYLANQKIGASQ